MILTTRRLTLRPITVDDAEALFEARGDAEVMRYWDWPARKTVAEVRDIFEAHIPELGDGSTLWWVAALRPEGPVIGECDLSEIDSHHGRAEVGFLFARRWWGQGYAQEAMEAVIDHAFAGLALDRLWARCHAGNTASQRLLKRLGFRLEGTLRGHVLRDGERRDCLVYGRLRNRSATKNGA
ncbi:MAG: GNAT family N-acetyltransferase [Alphaproteobacteria bacterium]|nr:GNAT family N-acetyltransferase [Alphaproteobacteria bacterium]MBV9694471.1 GNAT family N-acetyltransferase [Alphaproteobacteria bacterium]